ncbi:MAG: hypothetical protein O3C43_00995 [Verrucomicrobia bacterium]|nr:hypothetical protein [Verrucomicrobiota bacterium]MDA1065055.1 hypothetical protein [Verrucomicrobiota bacterium]
MSLFLTNEIRLAEHLKFRFLLRLSIKNRDTTPYAPPQLSGDFLEIDFSTLAPGAFFKVVFSDGGGGE